MMLFVTDLLPDYYWKDTKQAFVVIYNYVLFLLNYYGRLHPFIMPTCLFVISLVH